MALKDRTPFVVFLVSSTLFFAVNVITQHIVGKSEIDLAQVSIGAFVFSLLFGGYIYWKRRRK